MKSQTLSGKRGGRTLVVIFETGDEVTEGMLAIASENGLEGGHFSGIGALSRATLAFYDLSSKRYEEILIDEQVEVGALVGNLALRDDGPALHAHIVVGTRDGTARTGHLLEGHVRPTLEVFISETAPIVRSLNESVGLPLVDLP